MAGQRRGPRLALLLLAALAACESPSAAFDEAASRHGFQRLRVAGEGFDHVVFRKTGAAGPLHVYLESDGRPWLRRWLPAGDPTSRDPLVLDLMARDPAESVLLGRPCYHGLQDEPRCDAALWTARRFAPEVVASLATALRNLEQGRGRPVVLIGHSGGGVLAMLLAARLPQTQAVVTIAAPLDHAAWTSHHGYLPLQGSLNPVLAPPLPKDVRQLHLAGRQDGVVPPELTSDALARLGAPPPLVVADARHNDGWAAYWPAVLACLDAPGRLEAMAEADQDQVLLAPGVAEVTAVAGGDGGSLIECRGE